MPLFQEGDILIEINGIAVQNMPHNNVVQILKECPSNASAIFVVHRSPPPAHPYEGDHPGMGLRPAYANGVLPSSLHNYGYPPHNHGYRPRMKVGDVCLFRQRALVSVIIVRIVCSETG